MPDGDILHTDTVTRNARFPAARTGREHNMLGNQRGDMRFVGRGRVFHRIQSYREEAWGTTMKSSCRMPSETGIQQA